MHQAGADTQWPAQLLQWAVLLAEEFVRAGLVGAAYTSAAAGTPLSLLLGDVTSPSIVELSGGGSGGEPPRRRARLSLTLEQLALLHVVEAATDGEARQRPSGGEDGVGGGGDGVAEEAAALTQDDALFCVSRAGELIDDALALGAAAADSTALPSSSTGGGRLVLRPLLWAVGVLCDVVADALAAEAAVVETEKLANATTAERTPLGNACVLLLPRVLSLLSHVTPPPPPPSSLPPPTIDGDADSDATTDAPRVAMAVPPPPLPSPPPQQQSGVAPTTTAPPPRPAAYLRRNAHGGLRTSLTRLVALTAATNGVAAGVATLATDGGLAAVLNQCVMLHASPLLREWGLMAVRNLCAAGGGVPAAIAGLKAERLIVAPELAALGVTATMAPDGGVRVAARATPGGGGSGGGSVAGDGAGSVAGGGSGSGSASR